MNRAFLPVLVFGLISWASAMEENFQDQLCNAVRLAKYDDVVHLIEAGADVNGQLSFFESVTPLLCAAKEGSFEIAKLLISKGARVNKATDEKWWCDTSPLHMACLYGHATLVKLLIDYGADVNACNRLGHSVLHNAVAGRKLEIVKLLLDAGATIFPKEALVAMDYSSSTVFGGFEFKTDAGTMKGSPLFAAIRLKQTDCAKLLIDHTKDLPRESSGEKLLEEAYKNGNLPLIKILKDKGCTLKKTKGKWLITPIRWGDFKTTRFLINSGLDLEAKDSEYGATPLIWAANNGYKEICEMLYRAGANIGAKNKYGCSAAGCAKKKRNALIVSLVEKWRDAISLKSAQDHKEFVGLCKKLKNYDHVIEFLMHSTGPLQLKNQCINKIRKLVKEGKLKKEELPKLDEFGFEHLIAPDVDDKKDDNNNNEDKK